jgi:hypothetical protein
MQVPTVDHSVFTAMSTDGVSRQFYGPPPTTTLTITIPAGLEAQVHGLVNKLWVKANKRNSRRPLDPGPTSPRKNLIAEARDCFSGAKLTTVPETRKKLCNKAERLLREASSDEDSTDSESARELLRRVDLDIDSKTLDVELKAQRVKNVAIANATTGKRVRRTVVRPVGMQDGSKELETVETREQSRPEVLTMARPLRNRPAPPEKSTSLSTQVSADLMSFVPTDARCNSSESTREVVASVKERRSQDRRRDERDFPVYRPVIDRRLNPGGPLLVEYARPPSPRTIEKQKSAKDPDQVIAEAAAENRKRSMFSWRR